MADTRDVFENGGRGGDERLALDRRRFIAYFSSIGLGATLLPGALLAQAQNAPAITADMVKDASRIAGIELDEAATKEIVDSLNRPRNLRSAYEAIRAMDLGNATPPAIIFNPVLPGMALPRESKPLRITTTSDPKPRTDEDLAFLTVVELAHLVRTRQVTSTDLTRLYLERLKKYDPVLHCVITLTEELALDQARKADEEIAAGHYRGPLHGIPWGAKDLLAVRGYKTTFGASPYKDQVIDLDSTVFTRLTQAGAVLVAKLTMGALAMGDRWFGGLTRSPWDPKNEESGSSGSSAGPGAATAAGLVGFSIGTETRGSIMSPSARCGVTGLRPTFGRVSRYGAMALSWTMDKIGPMCRSAEDCAIVLKTIQGPDGKDNHVIDVPFNWDAGADARALRVGYLKSALEREIPEDKERPERAARVREMRAFDLAALDVIRGLGVTLVPIEIPRLGAESLNFILSVESAAAFDDLTRSGKLDMLSAPPERSAWVETFRLHRFVPAVEYIQGNRARYRLMEDFHKVFDGIDLFVGSQLGITNLTGHPEISLPHGFDERGQPAALRLTGTLFGEEAIVRLAHAYQQRTEFHRQRPQL